MFYTRWNLIFLLGGCRPLGPFHRAHNSPTIFCRYSLLFSSLIFRLEVTRISSPRLLIFEGVLQKGSLSSDTFFFTITWIISLYRVKSRFLLTDTAKLVHCSRLRSNNCTFFEIALFNGIIVSKKRKCIIFWCNNQTNLI